MFNWSSSKTFPALRNVTGHIMALWLDLNVTLCISHLVVNAIIGMLTRDCWWLNQCCHWWSTVLETKLWTKASNYITLLLHYTLIECFSISHSDHCVYCSGLNYYSSSVLYWMSPVYLFIISQILKNLGTGHSWVNELQSLYKRKTTLRSKGR